MESARKRLVLGAAMLEGSVPVSTLVPSLHHLLHYGKKTKQLGRLDPLAMWEFERLNYFFKHHFVRNNSRPMESAGLCVFQCFVIGGVGIYNQVLLPCLCDLQRVLLMYMTRRDISLGQRMIALTQT